MIKVAITINRIDMGGAARMVYELVKNIDRSRFCVKIICIDGKTGSFLEQQMIQERFDILFLKNFRPEKKGIVSRIIRRYFFNICDILSIGNLSRTLSKIKPDVIHAHQNGIWAGYWTIGRKIPLLATVHSRPDGTFNRLTEQIILKICISRGKIVFVAISGSNFDQIKSYWSLKDDHVRYVNNGIDINAFTALPHESFSYINVSRQDENKNQALILRAFAKLYHENSDITMKLYLVGDGPLHGELIRKAEALKIKDVVIFTGYVPSAVQYVSCTDIYISSSNREGLPLSVLEAMAAGLPIIATNAGSVHELAQENGILIPCNDAEALYNAMKTLRDNKELRQQKGRKSLAKVQEFSAVNMAEKYGLLYEEFGGVQDH